MHEAHRYHYLNSLGIQTWKSRSSTDADIDVSAQNYQNEATAKIAQTELINMQLNQTHDVINNNENNETLWNILEQEVKSCTACSLCKSRTQTVFGVGDKQAKLLIIGEAPGAQEDIQGKPFVGRAGQLLDAMLCAINLHRSQVFIANILKCRPPNNRDPDSEEVSKCTPFLQRQIALIQPSLILALGRISAHYLLNTTTPLSRMRGQQYHYGDQKTPLLVTFHPAYLLRSPREKAKAYEDLLKVVEFLGLNK